MTKSKKAKKEKAADFTRAKLKLGKGKKAANNATNTSFKARSIALPTQSITLEKDANDAQPTTKRNLTLDELMVHVKHYSANVRKDALAGMRELFGSHPELINPNLTILIGCTVRVIGDEESNVRKGLLQLYHQIFPLLPLQSLAPHASQILLHTTSALSHIFAEIRVDAVGFLNVLIDYAPAVVEQPKNQQRILDGYLGLLNLRSRAGDTASSSSSSLNLSISAKATVFTSLVQFLRVISSSLSSTQDNASPKRIPTWYFRPSFATEDAYDCFARSLGPSCAGVAVRWTEEAMDIEGEWAFPSTAGNAPSDGWNLADLDAEDEDGEADGDTRIVSELARVLHPLLVSTFLDVAPEALMSRTTAAPRLGGSEATAIELLWAISELTLLVYGTMLRRSTTGGEKTDDQLRDILNRMAVYFPFGGSVDIKRDIKSEQLLKEMSLVYCELTSLLVLSEDPKGKGRAREQGVDLRTKQVGEWVIKALKGEIITASQPMGQHLTATAYVALLPTIWSLLNNDNGETVVGRVWAATMQHCERASTTSAVKKLAVEFVSRLTLLRSDRGYQGRFLVEEEAAGAWIMSLGRLLWELNVQDGVCSETALRTPLIAIQRRVPLPQGGLEALAGQLVPYFGVMHPSRGRISGPWTRWGPEKAGIRRLGLDVVVALLRDVEGAELRVAVAAAMEGEADASSSSLYMLGLLSARQT